VVRKTTIPVFEKPVITRSKSASDLRALRENGIQFKKNGQQELRVEQDLEARPLQSDLQDDKDFELWNDSIRNELELASLEKFMSPPVDIILIPRTYRAKLQARLHSCNMILSQISSLLSTLNNLKLGFAAVADQTSSFQAQCDNLVQEEVYPC
jgi:Sec34-like family